jgi:hypothetical protein
MLRLTRDDFDDIPENYEFPVDEARAIATRLPQAFGPATDRGACDAARQVEAALLDVELRFARIREIAGYINNDPDRPTAA